ncbi:MAG: glycosyltransferase family 4 protein [Nitrospira sp. CG24B]|nr:MAG: glycosyltransferase family 4 protein [Nitrospira sp. CG24B]
MRDIVENDSRATLTDKLAIGNIMPKRRPKLLFLAFPFPPAKTPGSVRTWNIATYLIRLGWDVTVVVPNPAILRNVEDSEKVSVELERAGIKRIITDHRWRCLAPNNLKCWNQGLGKLAGGACRVVARKLGIDRHIGWIKPTERACSNLTADDVDLIFATGQPFAAFSLAKRLSERLGRPYVLDYRDPWTGNPHAQRHQPLTATRREASLLQDCAAITIVSPSWGSALDQRFGVGSKIHVVTNGYDSYEMTAVKPYDFGHCAFVYTGIFYPPKRSISPFLAALKLLRESPHGSANEWYFHYYGVDEKHVREQANRFGLTDRIVFHRQVPRLAALSAVKGASLAVVITSVEEEETLEDKGIVTGKIFEAVGLATPVLLIAPMGSDASAITATTGLVKSFKGSEIQEMASFLEDVVRGQAPQPRNIENCSWAIISQNLDALLRAVVVRDSCPILVGDGVGGRSGSSAPTQAR